MTPRRRRWLIAALLAVIGFAGALRIVYVIALPRIVRGQVVAALADLGFSRVTFDVRTTSLWATDLSNLREADGQSLQISGVAVRYSPLRALRGQLDSIRLDGARLEADLDRLEGGGSSSATTQPKPLSFDLPFDRLELNGCILVLRRENRALEVLVDGTLVRDADGSAKLRLSSTVSRAPLIVEGTISAGGRAIEVRTTAANVEVEEIVGLLPRELYNLVDSAGGVFNCSIVYALTEGTHAASMQIALRDVWVKTDPQIGLDVHGIDGSVNFDNLMAGSTHPRQVINIQRIKLAGQEFTNAVLAAQLLSPNELSISHAELDWAGGDVRVDPFTLNMSEPAIDTTVIVQHVDLANVLTMITQGQGTGTGTVSGSIPFRLARVQINGEQTLDFDFRGGSLRADAPGNLRLGESRHKLGTLLEQADSGFASDPLKRLIRDDLLESVKNFDYRVLEVRFHKTASGADSVLLRIHGREHTGSRVPINLDFNVEDIDAGVRAYHRTWKRVLDSVMRKAKNP